MSPPSQNDLWRSILSVSHRILRSRPTPSAQTTPRTAFVPPPLELIIPNDLTSFLSDTGLSEDTVDAVASRIQQGVQDLQRVLLESYRQTCEKYIKINGIGVTSDPSRHTRFLQSVASKQRLSFQQRIAQIKSECLAKCQSHPLDLKRTPFNNEYTPFFEKYYEYNAYPSIRDRDWLARKSMMTSRQIEVWFQNHRRRARKEGKIPQKVLMDNVPRELSIESLEECMGPFIARKRPRSPTPSQYPLTPPPERARRLSPRSLSIQPTCDTILDSTFAPTHAYPTKFTDLSNLEDDPFPCKSGIIKFPPVVWHRRPTKTKIIATKNPSIDDLCNDFSLLRIACSPALQDTDEAFPGPWYTSTCIGPILAPHPAFIRCSTTTPPPPRSRHSSPPRSPVSSDRPTHRNKRQRLCSPFGDRRQPSTTCTKSLSRASSNSSLSSHTSSSDLDTPDSSPQMSRALSLPSVYGIDDHLSICSREPFSTPRTDSCLVTAFDFYASSPKSLTTPLWSIPSRPTRSSLLT